MESGLGVWICLNLLITFVVPNISIGGHIGGLIGGGLAALVLFDLPDQVRLGAAATSALCAALGVAAVAGSIVVEWALEDWPAPAGRARSSSIERRVGGASNTSGWRMWPSSSTPSTSRGPGREK